MSDHRGSLERIGGVADLGLRAGGAVFMAVAILALRALTRLPLDGHEHQPGVTAFILAIIGFIGISAGCVLVGFGRHIFDEIEVSARWAPWVQDDDADGGDAGHLKREW